MESKPKRRSNTLLIVGVIVLIVLLIIWLTVADLSGDTDVAAQVIDATRTTLLPLA